MQTAYNRRHATQQTVNVNDNSSTKNNDKTLKTRSICKFAYPNKQHTIEDLWKRVR